MFFAILSLSLCEVKTLCLQSVNTNPCPEGLPTTSIVKTSAELLPFIVAGSEYSIFTDLDIADVEIKQLKLIKEVKIISTDSKKIAAKIAADAEHTGITLTGIELDVTKKVSSKALRDEALAADPKLSFVQMTLNTGASVKAASVVTVKSLQCASMAIAKAAITFIDPAQASISIVGDDVIDKITADTAGIKLSSSTDEVAIAGTKVTASVVSTITKDGTFTLTGDLTALTAPVQISLVYGNVKKAILTLVEETGFKKSPTPIVKVDTYYKIDTTKPLSEEGKATCTLDATTFLVGDGDKRKVPVTPEYCLYKTGPKDDKCPVNATILWSEVEIADTKNGENMVSIYMSGYDAAGIILPLTDYLARQLTFSGLDETKKEKIILTATNKDAAFTGNFIFNSIDLSVTAPKGSTDSTLSFKTLLLKKSSISAEAEPADSSAKGLKAATAITIAVNSVDLTSDPKSFQDFKAKKPTSFTVIDMKKAEFEGDGSKVTIDGVEFTPTLIPTPFTVGVPPNTELTGVEMIIKKAADKPGMAIPFEIKIDDGAKLGIELSGDWSANTIKVNVGQNGNFTGTKKNKDDPSPTFVKQGAGEMTFDGKKVEAPKAETPTQNGGLSGGGIAGIVIACIVVVAAIAVGVFFVIKKKKSPVAN